MKKKKPQTRRGRGSRAASTRSRSKARSLGKPIDDSPTIDIVNSDLGTIADLDVCLAVPERKKYRHHVTVESDQLIRDRPVDFLYSITMMPLEAMKIIFCKACGLTVLNIGCRAPVFRKKNKREVVEKYIENNYRVVLVPGKAP